MGRGGDSDLDLRDTELALDYSGPAYSNYDPQAPLGQPRELLVHFEDVSIPVTLFNSINYRYSGAGNHRRLALFLPQHSGACAVDAQLYADKPCACADIDCVRNLVAQKLSPYISQICDELDEGWHSASKHSGIVALQTAASMPLYYASVRFEPTDAGSNDLPEFAHTMLLTHNGKAYQVRRGRSDNRTQGLCLRCQDPECEVLRFGCNSSRVPKKDIRDFMILDGRALPPPLAQGSFEWFLQRECGLTLSVAWRPQGARKARFDGRVENLSVYQWVLQADSEQACPWCESRPCLHDRLAKYV